MIALFNFLGGLFTKFLTPVLIQYLAENFAYRLWVLKKLFWIEYQYFYLMGRRNVVRKAWAIPSTDWYAGFNCSVLGEMFFPNSYLGL